MLMFIQTNFLVINCKNTTRVQGYITTVWVPINVQIII